MKQVTLENGSRTTGILQFYDSLPEHIKPLQKTVPPYLPVDNGYYGYMGVVLHDTLLDLVQCHICGRWLKALSRHYGVHSVTHIEYKDRFGLYHSEPVARLKTLRKWSEMNKLREQVKNIEEVRLKNGINNPKNRQMGNKARKKDQWKNKYGTCEAQLKFRLEEAIKSNNGNLPTTVSKDGANLHRLFSNRFGSFEKGLLHYKMLTV